MQMLSAKLKAKPQQVLTRLQLIPNWRKYLFGAVILAGVGYLAWCKWGSQPLQPGAVILSVSKAPQITKMETTKTPPVRLVVVKDKVTAVAKLGLPPSEASDPKEALLTATAVARNRNGATVTTFVNLSTGQSRTDVTANKSPWFALEKGNVIGGSLGASSSDGYIGRAYFKHDFVQVKGNFIQGEVEGIIRPEAPTGRKTEGIGWVNVERRFDWP